MLLLQTKLNTLNNRNKIVYYNDDTTTFNFKPIGLTKNTTHVWLNSYIQMIRCIPSLLLFLFKGGIDVFKNFNTGTVSTIAQLNIFYDMLTLQYKNLVLYKLNERLEKLFKMMLFNISLLY